MTGRILNSWESFKPGRGALAAPGVIHVDPIDREVLRVKPEPIFGLIRKPAPMKDGVQRRERQQYFFDASGTKVHTGRKQRWSTGY